MRCLPRGFDTSIQFMRARRCASESDETTTTSILQNVHAIYFQQETLSGAVAFVKYCTDFSTSAGRTDIVPSADVGRMLSLNNILSMLHGQSYAILSFVELLQLPCSRLPSLIHRILLLVILGQYRRLLHLMSVRRLRARLCTPLALLHAL